MDGQASDRAQTEYFRDDRQGGNFVRVHSITPLLDGRYRYDVDRAFRD